MPPFTKLIVHVKWTCSDHARQPCEMFNRAWRSAEQDILRPPALTVDKIPADQPFCFIKCNQARFWINKTPCDCQQSILQSSMTHLHACTTDIDEIWLGSRGFDGVFEPPCALNQPDISFGCSGWLGAKQLMTTSWPSTIYHRQFRFWFGGFGNRKSPTCLKFRTSSVWEPLTAVYLSCVPYFSGMFRESCDVVTSLKQFCNYHTSCHPSWTGYETFKWLLHHFYCWRDGQMWKVQLFEFFRDEDVKIIRGLRYEY